MYTSMNFNNHCFLLNIHKSRLFKRCSAVVIVNLSMLYIKHAFRTNLNTNCTYPCKKKTQSVEV